MRNTVKYMRELAKEMVICRRKTKFQAGVKMIFDMFDYESLKLRGLCSYMWIGLQK